MIAKSGQTIEKINQQIKFPPLVSIKNKNEFYFI